MTATATPLPGASAPSAPGPTGEPLLGNLREVMADRNRAYMRYFHAHGNVVRYRLGSRAIHLIVHPDDVKRVLLDNWKNYARSASHAKLVPLVGEGLLTSDGETWKRQRRIAQPQFHMQRLASLATTMAACASDLADAWEACGPGATIDLGSSMNQLALRIVTRTLLGVEPDTEDTAGVGEVFRLALDRAVARMLSPFELPDWVPTNGNRQFAAAVAKLDALADGFIRARREAEGAVPDLLAMLLDAVDDEGGAGLGDRELRDQVKTIFLAGHETTANALTWTWTLLSQHPAVRERLHAEVDAVLGGRRATFADLEALAYTERVIQEAMRLYAPAPSLSRHVVEDDVLGGYHIPKGSLVTVALHVTHRHPDFWRNPEGFDPDRFAPEATTGRHRYAYVPFSAGPRNCIGSHFAMMEAKLTVATLAQRFTLDLLPGARIVPRASLTLQPGEPIPMALVRR